MSSASSRSRGGGNPPTRPVFALKRAGSSRFCWLTFADRWSPSPHDAQPFFNVEQADEYRTGARADIASAQIVNLLEAIQRETPHVR